MKVIGVAGGIGSGKSYVSGLLAKAGGFILDADKINHFIMLRGNVAYNEIVAYFGKIILNDEKEIDRAALAKIVFSDKIKLDKLVEINHKYVIEFIVNEIAKKRIDNGGYKFCVIDAPLLIEADLHKSCDYVIIVSADEEVRINRIINRDGLDEAMILKRMSTQLTNKELEKYGHFFIVNNGNESNNEVEKCVDIILRSILCL